MVTDGVPARCPLLSAGRAQYSMKLERYEVVPPNIQQDIIAKSKVAA